jgi:hypothetical protein
MNKPPTTVVDHRVQIGEGFTCVLNVTEGLGRESIVRCESSLCYPQGFAEIALARLLSFEILCRGTVVMKWSANCA